MSAAAVGSAAADDSSPVVTAEEHALLGNAAPAPTSSGGGNSKRIIITQQQQQQQQGGTATPPTVQVFRGGAAAAAGTRYDLYGQPLVTSPTTGDAGPPPQFELIDPRQYARQNGLVFDRQHQEWVTPDVLALRESRAGAPTQADLMRNYAAYTGSAPVEVASPHLPFFSMFYRYTCIGGPCGINKVALISSAYVPKLIPPDVLASSSWLMLTKPFPVDVAAPNNNARPIGTAAVEYYRVQSILGMPMVLYGVRKTTPFGVGVGGATEYHGGIYEVPADWATNKRFAVVSFTPMDGSVGLLRDTGEVSYPPLADVLASPSVDVQDALARLRRDYPYVSGDLFAARVSEVPDELYTGDRRSRLVAVANTAPVSSSSSSSAPTQPVNASLFDFTYASEGGPV